MEEGNYIKQKSEYFYKVSHCYGREEDSIFFQSNIQAEELIKILACLDFKFEELVDETRIMDEESVLKILIKFYQAEKLNDELVKGIRNLEPIELEEDGVAIIPTKNVLRVYNIHNDEMQLIEIDRYAARESCCGPNYFELMKRLPDTAEFIEMIKTSAIA